MEIAKLPKNSIKNRYANIYGCKLLYMCIVFKSQVYFLFVYICTDDESRVMLHRNSESESDYINASYIDVCEIIIHMYIQLYHKYS